jgi:SagB-type dehydrogenase family enzyme
MVWSPHASVGACAAGDKRNRYAVRTSGTAGLSVRRRCRSEVPDRLLPGNPVPGTSKRYSDLLFCKTYLLEPVRKIVKAITRRSPSATVTLPPPTAAAGKPIEQCLRLRRSCRMFGAGPVSLEQASQLLWAAQGVTGLGGLRTAPSAAALYPVHCYLVAMNVSALRPGLYAYDPDQGILSSWKMGDHRKRLVKVCFDQAAAGMAAMGLLLTASYGRAQREFGDRAPQLVHMESGHIGQNFLLQATSLSLGALGISKIDTAAMSAALDLPTGEEPVYLLLAGPK